MTSFSERNSNIELLRLLLLLMVIIIHVFATYMTSIQGEGTIESFFATWLYVSARPAVNCFILISGFFWGQENILLMIVRIVYVNYVIH